jgi:hypothetical protein
MHIGNTQSKNQELYPIERIKSRSTFCIKKRNLTEVRTISIVTPLQPAPQTLEFLQTKKQRESALSVEIVRRTRSMRTDNVASAVCGILHKNILSTAIVIAWFTGLPTKQIPPGG